MDEQSVSQLFESIIGMSLADVQKLPDESSLQRFCLRLKQRHEFENAVKDFITIVLTTPLFRPGEESLRLDLLKIPQLTPGRQWDSAIYATDEEFAKARLERKDRPLKEVLTLLRATRCKEPQTDDARLHMLHGRSHPTKYADPEHHRLFASIVESLRKNAKSQTNG